MSQMTTTELEAVYRRARKIARQQRVTPQAKLEKPATAAPSEPTIVPDGRSEAGRLLLLALLVFGAALLFGSSTPWVRTLAGPSMAVMSQTSAAATDTLVWVEMVWAERSGDTERLNRLGEAGAVFTLENGTPVQIVGIGFNSRKVLPVEGEHSGQAAWVPLNAVIESEHAANRTAGR